ncbi:hypothetical protein NG2371_01978 [Nocardia gamkensis]|nr:hypothetical protein [Nocardia gamkensis]
MAGAKAEEPAHGRSEGGGTPNARSGRFSASVAARRSVRRSPGVALVPGAGLTADSRPW